MASRRTSVPDGPDEQPAGDPPAISRLTRVTAELAAADSVDDIVTVVADHIRTAVHAAVSTLWLRDGDDLVMAGARGLAAIKAARWARHPMSQRTPLTDSVRFGTLVVAADAETVRRDYPTMAADTPTSRSVVAMPLYVADEVVGAIGLTFDNNREPSPAERDFLMTFADACAQTIRRVRATEAAAAASAHLRFLAAASVELASSLDYRVTLNKVAGLCVPEFATWCAVHLVDPSGQLQPLALGHAEPEKVAWAWELSEQYPVDMSASSGASEVLRTGVSELTCDITDEMIAMAAKDDEHLRLMRELDLHSVMIVPLRARGRALGTLTLIRTSSAAAFTDADVTVAEDIARRAAVAIDNARLHDETVAVATELQAALLPARLTTLNGWETAGYYRPDGTAEVGGDFYDAVQLRDGRLVVFIGDVMGHGITAAATMAQVRASIRALATVDPDPRTVLAHLDGLFEDLAVEPLVSLVYALVSPQGEVRLANAGHLPPLVLDPKGSARYLDARGRPPLGAGRRPTPVEELTIDPGAVLLLYTDGLVERRHENLDLGLKRLAGCAAALTAGPLEHNLAEIAEILTSYSPPQDDLAALAVRRNATA